MGTLLFIEGAILLALGSLWAYGSSEKTSYGLYKKTYGEFTKKDWEQRKMQLENPGNPIKILLIVGSLTLITAFVIFLV